MCIFSPIKLFNLTADFILCLHKGLSIYWYISFTAVYFDTIYLLHVEFTHILRHIYSKVKLCFYVYFTVYYIGSPISFYQSVDSLWIKAETQPDSDFYTVKFFFDIYSKNLGEICCTYSGLKNFEWKVTLKIWVNST